MSTIESPLKWIHTAHEPKWDFVLFRCAFDDEKKWIQCLEHLQACTSASLNQDGQSTDSIVMLNWVIQEDHELDGASTDTVRSRFRKLCALWNMPLGLGPCYEACLSIDYSSLQSILPHSLGDGAVSQKENPEAYVNVVDVLYDSKKIYDKADYKGTVKVAAHRLALLFSLLRERSLDQLYPGDDRIWSGAYDVSPSRIVAKDISMEKECQVSIEEHSGLTNMIKA